MFCVALCSPITAQFYNSGNNNGLSQPTLPFVFIQRGLRPWWIESLRDALGLLIEVNTTCYGFTATLVELANTLQEPSGREKCVRQRCKYLQVNYTKIVQLWRRQTATHMKLLRQQSHRKKLLCYILKEKHSASQRYDERLSQHGLHPAADTALTTLLHSVQDVQHVKLYVRRRQSAVCSLSLHHSPTRTMAF